MVEATHFRDASFGYRIRRPRSRAERAQNEKIRNNSDSLDEGRIIVAEFLEMHYFDYVVEDGDIIVSKQNYLRFL